MAKRCPGCEELAQKVQQLEAELAAAQRMLRGKVSESLRTLPTLGPFGIIANVPISLQIATATCMYELVGPVDVVQSMRQALPVQPTTGSCSPLFLVTLDAPSRANAQIPQEATHFCFVYPAFSSGEIPPEKLRFVDMDDPRHSFVMLGGFAYTRQVGTQVEVLQCNAIARGADLCFGPQLRLPVAVLQELHRQDRMQPVTVDVIKQTGAQFFAWINPGEFADLLPEPAPHGAFAYEFDSAAQHRYFAVVGNQSPTTQRSAAALQPFRLISDRFQASGEDAIRRSDSGCTVCMAKSPSVVFMPCRHLTCCEDCAPRVTQCPICQKQIEDRLSVYQ